MAPPARVRRVAPHPCARLGHVAPARSAEPRVGVPGPRGRAAPPTRGRPDGRRPSPWSDDTLRADGRASSSCAAARRADDRPARRGVDPFYGEHFWPASRSASRPAAIAVVFANVSRNVAARSRADALRLRSSARPSSARACWCSSDARDDGGSLVAWLLGWLVFAPVPFLVLAFVFPGSPGSRRSGSSFPCSIVEESPWRGALARAWQSRTGRLRPRDRLARHARVLVLLSQAVLAFVLRELRGRRGLGRALPRERQSVSPLLFIGAALLYVDQAARVEVE